MKSIAGWWHAASSAMLAARHERRAGTDVSNTRTIVVDAMGGDHAPAATVQGAIEAVRQFGLQVLLVGRETVLRRHLARLGGSPRGQGR